MNILDCVPAQTGVAGDFINRHCWKETDDISFQRSRVVLFRISERNLDLPNDLTRFALDSRNPYTHLDLFATCRR